MDPEKIPGGMRPVSESLYSDGRINVCVRTQETTSRHLCNLFSMHPKYCHGNGRCKHTHTHAIINKGPLWIFSGMSGEALGHTTASKHGSDRVEEDGSANGRGITAPQALVQAGTTNISICHFCTFVIDKFRGQCKENNKGLF